MLNWRNATARFACLTLLTVAAATAQAATLATGGAGFEPPGGVTVTPSGSSGSAGGLTRTYDLGDSTQFDQLWYGAYQPLLGNFSINQTVLGSVSGFGTNVMTWSGVVTFAFGGSSPHTETVNGRFVSTVVSGGSNWLLPGPVGISGAGSPLAVFEVTDPNQFKVNSIFEIEATPGNWTAFQPWFDAHNGAGDYGSRRSFTGQLWYTDPVPGGAAGGEVPLPAALPLFATGLGTLAFLARRRKRKAAAANA